MRPLTESIPKALVPVLGRPFAEIQLEWLASSGVNDVVYSIGYRGDLVREALGDGSRVGLRLTYVDEDGPLRRTAGGPGLAAGAGVLRAARLVLHRDLHL